MGKYYPLPLWGWKYSSERGKSRELICSRVSKTSGELQFGITAHFPHGGTPGPTPWSLCFPKIEAYRKYKVSVRNAGQISRNVSGNLSTWKCPLTCAVFPLSLINGLLFFTRVYFSVGCCHLDVCAFGSQDSQEFLQGIVKDLGWHPILEQDGIHSLFPASQWCLPPEEHPVKVGSPRKYLPPQRGHQKGLSNNPTRIRRMKPTRITLQGIRKLNCHWN